MEKLREKKWFFWAAAGFLFAACLASRISIAYFYPVDGPGDGVIYTQIAKNILEHNVFSLESEAPFSPTLVRLPGYPLFVVAVYSVFGHDNNTAVRTVQAVFDAATCVIVSLLAWLWTDDDERKRKNALWTFLVATLCPFIAIYAACLLTETMTTFLMALMVLTATLGFKAAAVKRSLLWWFVTGLPAGFAVLLRPDSGLFALGIGLTLVISDLFLDAKNEAKFLRRSALVLGKGSAFSLAFIVVLTPWTIRNERVFGVFQPLAPAHAEMPGEFVPHGYGRWLRTWVDDSRFVEPMLWNLDEKPILLEKLPSSAFDSLDERTRVAELLEQYNYPPGFETQYSSANSDDETDSSSDEDDASDDSSDSEADDSADSEANMPSETLSEDELDENRKYVVNMTPGIDARFAVIADERIANAPFRYYLFLPAKRAASMWFDSHSVYYPFGGQMSPISDLDYDVDQQYWLPAFTALMWIYSLLAIGGVIVMWRNRAEHNVLQWLILLALMTLPRIVFFSSVENPEPRYLVELFAFTAILGGFFLGNLKLRVAKTAHEEPILSPVTERTVSLDVFRGMTIAAMTLVNEPGTWSAIYQPLAHAEWNGATPADWIFPFFLFIVGVSITFSFGKQIQDGIVKRAVYFKIFKRAFLLFVLGIILEIFPFYNIWTAAWFDPAATRIMGVLQRIAICYLIASIIFLHTNWKRQTVIAVVILLAYWAFMTLINVPGCEATTFNDKACNLAAYLDRVILGTNHIWNQSTVLDPEGVLSTLPAMATTLIGVLTGQWLRSTRSAMEKCAGMAGVGVAMTVIGLLWSLWFPLNKSLWTSSYVLYTGGLALCILAACYLLVDIKGYRKWSVPFLIFGSNAIALYVGSTVVGKALQTIELSAPHDQTIFLQEKIFNTMFLPFVEPAAASLLYAGAFVLISMLFLWPLYRWKILIKI